MDVLCIDLKSFYASVECSIRGLDPFTTPLVVTDVTRGPGSIVLAVSPYMKTLNVSSRCRLHEVPKLPNLIYARPRMKKYMEYAQRIYDIYLEYVSEEDIHVYSIDEAFLDVTGYLTYYQKKPEEIAAQILASIQEKLHLPATCGIGKNMFQAKVALDILAKKQTSGIALLNHDLFKEKIGSHKPLLDIWGIGRGIFKRLLAMNIHTLDELAATDPKSLEKEFGIMGLELYMHAHGDDPSIVSRIRAYQPATKTFGRSQVMFEDYKPAAMRAILMETVDDIVTELVMRKMSCQVVALGIGYSKTIGGGFGKQKSFTMHTNSRKMLLDAFLKLYDENIEDHPIRVVHVRVGKLRYEPFVQTDLFTDAVALEKEQKLVHALGTIQEKYGKSSIYRAMSKLEGSTLLARNKMIGGHHAE